MKVNKIKFILFLYHLLFTIVSYQYAVNNKADSHLYWAKTFSIDQYSWLDFLDLNTNFILFLNYPLIILGFPFLFGFLLYCIIGFLGILKFIQWAELAFVGGFEFRGINMSYLIFFLPNLHFWTATLGKEPIIFWGIASVLFGITTEKYKSFSFILGSLAILIIRPHVALMLLSAIAVVFLFHKTFSLKRRILLAAITFTGVLVLLYVVFQSTNINYWDWKRICYFNEYSILSFKHSGSYVPMLDYSYGYKWFSFNFRPLFFDAHSTLTVLASIENLFSLVVFVTALFLIIRFYHSIDFTVQIKVIFLFTFIACLLYVERYANLGIFMRTKIMFSPLYANCFILYYQTGCYFEPFQNLNEKSKTFPNNHCSAFAR
ncbi:hypothetical protein [Flavobacterium sp.]|uniref:hypothetical protein n=1 Tax=Flavobacterium sp. TaxID=239 RepID=UPI0025F05E52|nr:hypothetical protein [Flavobacterium sp.]